MKPTAALFGLWFGLVATSTFADEPKVTKPADSPATVQDLIFLGDTRPIFLRLRMTLGDRPFRSAWLASVKSMHTFLDRDKDGKVTVNEADKAMLATLVRVANGGTTAMPRGDLDVRPKDGVVSIEELSDALMTALGPFRVQDGKLAGSRPDALFEQLDRNHDGRLTRAELVEAPATLHRLDLDDDELIDSVELEPFANPLAMQTQDMPGQRGRINDIPLVLDLAPDDSSLRPVRLLLKKYDKGGKGATAGDNKLAVTEFAIDPKAFARGDADSDGALDTDELRRFLARVVPDLELIVTLSPDASGKAEVVAAGPGSTPLPSWAKVQKLQGSDIELTVDEVRLELHVDDGSGAIEGARQSYMAQFQAGDTDNNGYLEKSELTKDKDHPSPLAALFDLLDRDGDGKLYPKELEEFVDRQAEAARDRMVLTTSDQGRAIFSVLDLNRDRMLGLREIRETVARVSSWDLDQDARIAADEIPHYYRFTVGRSRLSGIGSQNIVTASQMNPPEAEPVQVGPTWFRRMDRNRDGDISRREFRGPQAQFDRHDIDHDGLIDPIEAANPVAQGKAPTVPKP